MSSYDLIDRHFTVETDRHKLVVNLLTGYFELAVKELKLAYYYYFMVVKCGILSNIMNFKIGGNNQ